MADRLTQGRSFAARGPAASAETAEDLLFLTDATPQPTLICDLAGGITYANPALHALARLCGHSRAGDGAPLSLADLGTELIPAAVLASASRDGEWKGQVFVSASLAHALVLQLHVVALRDQSGKVARFALAFGDISAAYEGGLHNSSAELQLANRQLRGAQELLIQSEKLASMGQLAAGVAHEINNPIGYVHSNLLILTNYSGYLLTLIDRYEAALVDASNSSALAEIGEMRKRFDFDFVRVDLPKLVAQSREGLERVRKIVQDLKDFSRSDAPDAWIPADVNRGLETTLNVVWNDLKYKARMVKNYAELPLIECVPSELNQVFLNMLVNAGQAIAERGVISVATALEGDEVVITIGDDGVGIPAEVLPMIFDPFFTTKPVGTGTGLGLSISYGIINKHHGRIEVSSTVGQGTQFRIHLPVRQSSRTHGDVSFTATDLPR